MKDVTNYHLKESIKYVIQYNLIRTVIVRTLQLVRIPIFLLYTLNCC